MYYPLSIGRTILNHNTIVLRIVELWSGQLSIMGLILDKVVLITTM